MASVPLMVGHVVAFYNWKGRCILLASLLGAFYRHRFHRAGPVKSQLAVRADFTVLCIRSTLRDNEF